MRISRTLLSLSMCAALCSACRVGPRYVRPPIDAPATFRGAPADSARSASLGEAKWWNVFGDEELQRLIAQALTENYDVRVAAARILQARAQLTITRADQFPTVTANASATGERTPATRQGGFAIPASNQGVYHVDATVTWEIDFWGKFRSATEAQRATLLGTQWAARAVLVSVVDLVAQGYFTLRELDLELEIARRTLTAREESLRLTRVQEAGGIVSMLDVREAEQLAYTAQSVITDTERLITQQENALSILLGRNPGPIPRGRPLVDQPEPPEVPAGLPSSLIERRPDIRQAEQTLIASTARIGVAQAALFPDITLTGSGGFQSNALSALFSGPAALWSVSGGLVQQIFNAGSSQGQRQADRGAATGVRLHLSANGAAGVPRGVRCARGVSEDARASTAVDRTRDLHARRRASLRHSLSRRRGELSRSVDEPDQFLQCGAGARAGPIERATHSGAALRRPRRRLATVTLARRASSSAYRIRSRFPLRLTAHRRRTCPSSPHTATAPSIPAAQNRPAYSGTDWWRSNSRAATAPNTKPPTCAA